MSYIGYVIYEEGNVLFLKCLLISEVFFILES